MRFSPVTYFIIHIRRTCASRPRVDAPMCHSDRPGNVVRLDDTGSSRRFAASCGRRDTPANRHRVRRGCLPVFVNTRTSKAENAMAMRGHPCRNRGRRLRSPSVFVHCSSVVAEATSARRTRVCVFDATTRGYTHACHSPSSKDSRLRYAVSFDRRRRSHRRSRRAHG